MNILEELVASLPNSWPSSTWTGRGEACLEKFPGQLPPKSVRPRNMDRRHPVGQTFAGAGRKGGGGPGVPGGGGGARGRGDGGGGASSTRQDQTRFCPSSRGQKMSPQETLGDLFYHDIP